MYAQCKWPLGPYVVIKQINKNYEVNDSSAELDVCT